MEESEIIQYISLYLLSIVKLVLGSVPLSMVYIKLSKLSFIICMTLCCLGGFTGMIIFTRLGKRLWIWLDGFAWYRSYKSRNVSTVKSRRRMINIRTRYGLWGIAFLSPVILSIPGGCLLAARFYKNKSAIYLRMTVSIILWVWGSGAIMYMLIE